MSLSTFPYEQLIEDALREQFDDLYTHMSDIGIRWSGIAKLKYTTVLAPALIVKTYMEYGSLTALWELHEDEMEIPEFYEQLMSPLRDEVNRYMREIGGFTYTIEHDAFFVVFTERPLEDQLTCKLRTNMIPFQSQHKQLLFNSLYLD